MNIHIAEKRYLRWIAVAAAIVVAFIALWYTYRVTIQMKKSEEERVRLWANAVEQRMQLVNQTETFFEQISLDERRKIEIYTNILQSFDNQDLNLDLNFSLAYVNYIVDSCKTPLIITDKDSVITVPKEREGQKLQGLLLDEYSVNQPFHYTVWGMPMNLYYKQSKLYDDMQHMLNTLNESFLTEIANNSVSVPVLIVDSSRTHIINSGNIDTSTLNSIQKLQDKLKDMQSENDPIILRLIDNQPAYVYYESSTLLSMLRTAPFVLFIFAILLTTAVALLVKTTHKMEQNRIWVGLAKETAHQLGTPISSLMAWNDYLQGKTLTTEYANEIGKDLNRLETIARRFSKIGSTPELKEDDVCAVIENVVTYLRTRVSKKIKFSTIHKPEPVIAPINVHLLEWVIENLCKNAIDAMEGNGSITITLIDNDNNVFIEVADTGKGIAPSIQRRIFDSGFTTKKRGWGLGLSLSRRIVNDYHKGKLELKYSAEGQGSVFMITLSKHHKS